PPPCPAFSCCWWSPPCSPSGSCWCPASPSSTCKEGASDVRLRTGPLRVAVHDRAGLRTPCAPGLLQRVLADVTDPGERGGGRTPPGPGPFGTDLRSAPDHRGDRASLHQQCPGFVGRAPVPDDLRTHRGGRRPEGLTVERYVRRKV